MGLPENLNGSAHIFGLSVCVVGQGYVPVLVVTSLQAGY